MMNGHNRALMILSYINSRDYPLSINEIALSLNIPLSTVYRIVRILKEWQLITEAVSSDKLTAGPASYHASYQFQEHSFLGNSFHPFLKDLVHESKETAAIIIPTPYHSLCVDLVESPLLLKCSFSKGSRQSLTKGASAKTILAFQASEKTHQLLFHHYPHKQDQTALLQELSEIQKRGYGLSMGEIDQEVWGVSFPLYRKNQFMAVLTTMAPHYRAQTNREKLINLTQKHAQNINYFLKNTI